MRENDFVTIPSYVASEQTFPMTQLRQTRTAENERIMTAKLYYSTDYCGSYDLDAGAFTGVHCALDLKLPLGTPVGAVAGGRVQYTGSNERLGVHVIVEHRHPTDGIFFSIYAHLGSVSVRAGQDITAGQVVGIVGMTGETSAPHVHLQIDRRQNGETVPHTPHVFASAPDS
ncbi:M23 family metallopeptidase, partial [Candidatus Peregrinibacteria bacterium]|nr:M23 family metallopeptidase [Candidatus Peregrinibacteria bacterium]